MNPTLVLQSHRDPLPYPWLESCLASVRAWAEHRGFDYQWLGDEIFDALPEDLRAKTQGTVVATDLARLYALRRALEQEYARAIWLDADMLVCDEAGLVPLDADHGVGREVWIEDHPEVTGRYRARTKVHNAYLQFDQGNAFLEFYIDSAERLLRQNSGPIAPQFIGPKLLTALHNVVQLPVLETAAMLSPPVLQDLARGGGSALALFQRKSAQTPAAVNLCASLYARGEITEDEMDAAIEALRDGGLR